MRDLTLSEISAVNGAGGNRAPAYYCYPVPSYGRGYATVGALAGAAVVGGAVALGVAGVVKLKLLALALC